MPVRRKLDFSSVSDMPVAKRVKRLERTVAQRKPEMKHITFDLTATIAANNLSVLNLCQISQGDLINNRSADRIKVYRIEIRGLASNSLDLYILQAHGPAPPVLANFNGSVGAYILDSQTNSKWTEWKHYRNLYASGTGSEPIKMVQRFSSGITVKYEGTSTTPADNGLYFVALNRLSTEQDTYMTARVWYTDA